MLDNAQKKIIADFFEKFALAIATATAVRLLFENGSMVDEWVYALAAVVIIVMLALAMGLVHGTEEKRDGERGRLIAAREEDGKEGAKRGAVQAQRKRRNGKSAR